MQTTKRKVAGPAADAGPAAEWVPLDRLLPWAKNPRKNDVAVASVAESIRLFGFGAPIVARRETGEVIAGHTRLKAAKLLKLKTVPVRYLDLDETQAHELALADNKLGEIAEWDKVGLAAVFSELKLNDASAALLGWSADEFQALVEDGRQVNGEDDANLQLPPKGKARSKVGQVYDLGPHRLICGDARDPNAWKKLLGEERLNIVWTDPPYGVAIVGGNHALSPTERKARGGKTIDNDDLDEEELLELLRGSLGATAANCAPGAAWYVASPSGPPLLTFGVVLKELGIYRQTLTWVKDVFVMGRSDYHYKHETIFYGWEPSGRHHWCGARDLHSLLEFSRPKRSEEHPTMKPPELIQACLRNSSRPGDLVGDPFAGSGSTLIAAAREGRKARLIELDPRYCDVIRRRWTRFAETGGVEPGRGALAA